MKKVSFDFDGTLDKKHIQQFAIELINSGVDVYVNTTRFIKFDNSDLFEVVNSIGLSSDKVNFTNHTWKAEFFKENNLEFIWHLDDNYEEFFHFRRLKSKTKVIQVNSGNWKQKCIRLLNL